MLSLRRVGIDTYRENVAFLHRDCTQYQAEAFQSRAKVEVLANGKRIVAVLNIVEDASIVRPDELGVCTTAFEQLGLAEGERVRVDHATPPASMEAVKRKINGDRLDPADYEAIIGDIVAMRFSKMEMAAFLVATGQDTLDRGEVLSLTRAMSMAGERLSWPEELVADKHCIGGIPNNRTTMLVVPIVAAHGMLIPKTSSRAITSPAGTADTMECLARVDLSRAEIEEVVRSERGCICWGGRVNLSPADDILISVERPLGIDTEGQMVASILSKKLSAGSTDLLLDIPIGPSAKVRDMRAAQHLRKLFEFVGDNLHLHIRVIITDGSQPIGRGIGPVLEARDVMSVLHGDPNAPPDLRQKALLLAGRIIEFDPDVRGGTGFEIARDILDSGRALRKMKRICEAQGAPETVPESGAIVGEAIASQTGYVRAIDCYRLARIARLAGAPMAKGAGVDLLKKRGDFAEQGEPLFRVHASYQNEFNFAMKMATEDCGYTLSPDKLTPQMEFEW